MSRFNFLFLGGFFLLISFLSILNIIYSYYFNLYINVDSYISSLVVSLILTTILFIVKKNDSKVNIYNKIIAVLTGYLIIPIIIALPYSFSIYNLSLVDSYFEAVSGFTSTGFTIFNNLRQIDESLLLWRSTSQWVGGLYFLFSIIILIDIFDSNLRKSLTNFISFTLQKY